MAAKLVAFRCGKCGSRTYRHRTAYEAMMEGYGQAWCILCAQPRFGPQRCPGELLDVAQALNAASRARLAETRRLLSYPA
jgi:hypothetical protein